MTDYGNDGDTATLVALRQQADLLIKQGRFPEAAVVCGQIIEIDGGNAEPYLQLATLHARMGALELAMPLYERAIVLAPGSAIGYYSLANVQKKIGRIAEAIANLRRAVELDPRWDPPLSNLASTLMYAGSYAEACECYRQLLARHPGDAGIRLSLAAACARDGQVDEAVELYWQVLKGSPADGDVATSLGQLLYDSHRYAELLEYCDYLRQQFPASAEPDFIEAKVRARQGEWRQARSILERHREKQPLSYSLVSAYALIARPAGLEGLVVSLIEALLQQAGETLPRQQRAALNFELARLLDYRGEYERAFAAYRAGNQLMWQGFDLDGLRNFVADAKSHLDRPFFQRRSHSREEAARPVFIIGMPRSGTSLVEQILDSHSQVFGAGELTYINDIARHVVSFDGSYGAAVAALDDEALAMHARGYLEKLARLNPSARYVTDKMPDNFFHLGLIARLFPNARVIHCQRDPVDVCLSCYFQMFTGHAYSYDLATLAEYYRIYHDLMQHWRGALDLPIFTLRYEAFIDLPQQTIAALLSFLDLPWEDGCMRYYENPRVTMTSSNEQVRQPLYKRSLERWRHYEHHIAPLIESLGDLRTERGEAADVLEGG